MNTEALHPSLLPRILLKHSQLPFVSVQTPPPNLSICISPVLCVYRSCLHSATQSFSGGEGLKHLFVLVSQNQSELRCLHTAFGAAVILEPSV